MGIFNLNIIIKHYHSYYGPIVKIDANSNDVYNTAMTGLAHALAGSVVALKIKNPWRAAPLAFLSHFVLDSLPHFGKVPFYTFGSPVFPFVVATDAILAAYATYYLCAKAPKITRSRIVLCVILAIAPDVMLAIKYALYDLNFWFFDLHERIQWYENPPGIITEIAAVTALIVVARKLLLGCKGAQNTQSATISAESID